MSLKTEIEAIVGDIDSPDYTAQAVLYLTEGVKFITKYIMNNPEFENRLTSSATLNNSSTTLSLVNILRVVSVTRTDGSVVRRCYEIPPYKAGEYADINSIFYTSKLDPKYYVENNVLKIIPTPTASQTAVVRKIQPDTSVALSDTAIDNFPDELERGVVLYASKELLRKFLSVKNSGLPSNMSIPSTPSTATVATVTVGALGSAPAYTKTSLTLTSAPSISALSIGASAPASITLGTVAYTDASVGDAATTGEAVGAITIPSITDANVTTVVPSYTKTSLSLTSAPSISALTVSASVPSTISLSTVSYTDASTGDASSTAVSAVTIGSVADADVTTGNSNIAALPSYGKPSINMTAAPNPGALNITTSIPGAPSVTDVTVGSLGTAPSYTVPSLSLDYGTISGSDTTAGTETALGVDDFIYSEDVELASVSLEKQQQLIEKYRVDIQNNLNEFQDDVAEYQANLQKILQQADVESEESSQKIQKYSQEIQSYSAVVGQQVQQYQLNLEREIQIWSTKRNTELQQYQLDVQNELNDFNEKASNYQIEVTEELQKQNVLLERVQVDAQVASQKAQQDAAATTDVAKFNKQKDLQISLEARAKDMEALMSNNTSKVADYQARVQSYQIQINDQVQEYAQNLERELQLFNIQRNTELQKHQNDIQDELNEFNKDNVRYQAEVQEELTKHNTALEKAIAQAQIDAADAQQESKLASTRNLQNQQKDLQIKLEAAAKDMEVIITQNSAKVADYNARIQLYQAQVADEVQQYQLNLQRELELFSAKRSTELQKHQNDIQDELNEFNKELAIYQADLQQKFKQADASSEKEAMEIQNYMADVESYGQQINKEVQNFNTKLQKISIDYQWLQGQYQMVVQDLIQFLQPYLPASAIQGVQNEATAND